MEFLEELLRRLSWEWLLGVAVLLLALDKTGFVQSFIRKREEVKVSDREQLSEDQRDLITRLEAEAERERKWRLSSDEFYMKQIETLRKTIAERDDTIRKAVATSSSSERGNARLRHAVNNLLQDIYNIQLIVRSKGIDPLPYTNWRDLLGIDPDLDKKITSLFEEHGLRRTDDGLGEPC